MRVVIGADGSVASVRPSPLADAAGGEWAGVFLEAVREAVGGWRYDPCRLRDLEDGPDMDGDGRPDYTVVVGSTPVPVYLDLSFRFEIVGGAGRLVLGAGDGSCVPGGAGAAGAVASPRFAGRALRIAAAASGGRQATLPDVVSVSAVELSCASCGANLVVEATRRTARCPYCDTPSVVDRPASADRPDPVFAIGFAVDRQGAAGRMRTFLRSRRWAPGGLRRATSHQLEGVYVPAYLYTATAASRFRAEIGEEYIQTQVDSRKKGVKRVRKTEYRTLEGSHRCYVDGLVVTASSGLGNDELEAVEPYDPAGLRRFTPALVSGWIAEEPSLTREASLELARTEARAQVLRRLHGFMPGDSHRGLQAATNLGDESMDLVLAPVWVCAVRWREDRPPVRLLVNGQTGKVAGAVPVSWAKVAAVVGAGLALVALAVLIGALL